MNECTICTYQIGKPSPKYEAPIINYRVFLQDNGIVQIIMNKKDYETLNKYAYLGQIQQEIIDNLQSKIDKAIEYYETHQQECVIGRNKDDKLIRDYYLPAQCSKKLYKFLKEDE